MSEHGHETASPIHGESGGHGHSSKKESSKYDKYVSSLPDDERIGLTSEEAERRVNYY